MSRRDRDQRGSAKSTLGKIALQQRFVPADGMRSGPRKKDRASVAAPPMAEQLTAMRISEAQQQRATAVGLPPVALRQLSISTGVTRLVPIELSRDYSMLVLDLNVSPVPVAVADPPTQAQLDEFEFLLGRGLTCYLASAADLVVAIEGIYAASGRGELTYQLELIDDGTEGEPITGEVPAPPVAEAAPVLGAGADTDAEPEQGSRDSSDESIAVTAGPVVKLDPAFSEPPRALESVAVPDLADKRLVLSGVPADVGQLLRDSLGAKGLAIEAFDSGQALIDAVERQLPTAVLIETELSDVHGLEVIRRLRGGHEADELPILVTSVVHQGWRFAADLQRNFGVEHFFERPLDLVRLQQALLSAMLRDPLTDEPEVLGSEAEGHLRHGMVAFEQGDLDAAVKHLRAGADAAPGAFQIEYHLGLLYGRKGDFFSAMAALEHAAQLQPRHFSALKNLAVVYQRAGFRHKATETWERAMWNAPDDDTRATIKEHMLRLL